MLRSQVRFLLAPLLSGATIRVNTTPGSGKASASSSSASSFIQMTSRFTAPRAALSAASPRAGGERVPTERADGDEEADGTPRDEHGEVRPRQPGGARHEERQLEPARQVLERENLADVEQPGRHDRNGDEHAREKGEHDGREWPYGRRAVGGRAGTRRGESQSGEARGADDHVHHEPDEHVARDVHAVEESPDG